MKKILKTDEWSIIEEGFHADYQRGSESIFSLGNGRFGQRGNFEESYSSDSLQGSYLAGISFLDRTRVGWWKNGYPKYFSRIPNSPNWSGIHVRLIDEEVDLAIWDISSFSRRLDMREGVSYRDFEVTSPKGNTLRIHVEHINSMANPNLCAIKYSVTSVNYEGKISLIPYLDANIKHESSNFNEKMWNVLRLETKNEYAYLWTQTKHEDSQACFAMTYQLFRNSKEITTNPIRIEKEKQVGFSAGSDIKCGERVTLIKYTTIATTLYYDRQSLVDESVTQSKEAKQKGWDTILEEHRQVWKGIWDESDVIIEGDPEAQQGIRFNIFQLHQTYRGDDPRLNIGAKGFTGEKYGGNTHWNTELCCIPYFLFTHPKEIARNLLLYRYNQLPKAIENARKLGFNNGAALYPMVTINGDECHNEWEITFEEIHRNAIICYVIAQYTVMTGDKRYLADYGLEVMIAICRFWEQRVSFSQKKKKYVILGVTGPNEYENNVDNNWYTNYSCVQCLKVTIHYLEVIAHDYPDKYTDVRRKTSFQYTETKHWQEIIDNMYFPEDDELGIIVQHDGYMDKELKSVDEIPVTERPINQHWSWDRILRSCYIKQSDVVLGLYLYYFAFDLNTMRRNFKFYEPKTLHESSLSPFVHSTIAARTGDIEKAYTLFLHSIRLDLDDYNNEISEGLHITSMAGSWLALAKGFAGMQIINYSLRFTPVIPQNWKRYTFKTRYQERLLLIEVTQEQMNIHLLAGDKIEVYINNEKHFIDKGRNSIMLPSQQLVSAGM
ncbi:family 65 glycosyl hydrolase domain-containing protein [Bacteroides sp. 51]|uniref:family 65 glycosyl hydrolase domain-containing protein n=1 Tax=Bacteroides sp. 51 TaxID=2302938 RepID=UPI0013D4EA71|nr:family 65 glycosyl hydrolase domain-containing protein [Bacteroides sp. 51]NDV82847.1 family 65 glycosyl hydrolase [Bacteroides sp. 51]